MNQSSRPSIQPAVTTSTRPSASGLLDQVISNTAATGFDPEAWHVINDRDNALIADEVLNGSGSSKFVYQFNLAGTNVTGISVVGARHLASSYGGIRHRLIASTLKRGSLFTFTSYPSDGSPMRVSAQVIPELADEDDFYSALIEITDVKKGNAIQVEHSETRQEKRRDGSRYDRPHYQKIAQAKAYRNGVLSVIPQDVQLEWKEQMLRLGKSDIVTKSVIAEKRAGVLQFAAAKGIAVNRHAVEDLTMDQIAGLAEAARTKDAAQFTNAAVALGLIEGASGEAADEPAKADASRSAEPKADQPRRSTRSTRTRAEPERDESAHDPETGEIEQQQPEARDERPEPPTADDGDLF